MTTCVRRKSSTCPGSTPTSGSSWKLCYVNMAFSEPGFSVFPKIVILVLLAFINYRCVRSVQKILTIFQANFLKTKIFLVKLNLFFSTVIVFFQNTEQMGKSIIRHFGQKSQQYVKALLTIYIFQLYCKSPRCLFIQGCNGRDILNRDKVNLYFGQAAIHLKNCSECAISFLCTKCLEESYEGSYLILYLCMRFGSPDPILLPEVLPLSLGHWDSRFAACGLVRLVGQGAILQLPPG